MQHVMKKIYIIIYHFLFIIKREPLIANLNNTFQFHYVKNHKNVLQINAEHTLYLHPNFYMIYCDKIIKILCFKRNL